MSFQFMSSDAIALQQDNCISPALHIQGNINSTLDIYITNTVNGNISSKQTVFIAQNACVLGTIEALNVVIWGTVQGNVKAHHIAALGNTAKIEGTLLAKKLVLSPEADLSIRPQLI